MAEESGRPAGSGPPSVSLEETMDSLAEPRWPPALAVMKVSALGRSGPSGRPREASPTLRRRKNRAPAASWARILGSAPLLALA